MSAAISLVPLGVATIGRVAVDPQRQQLVVSSPEGRLVFTDPDGRILATITTLPTPNEMVIRGDTLFVLCSDRISRIDLASRAVLAPLITGLQTPRGLVLADGYLWMIDGDPTPDFLCSVHPDTGARRDTTVRLSNDTNLLGGRHELFAMYEHTFFSGGAGRLRRVPVAAGDAAPSLASPGLYIRPFALTLDPIAGDVVIFETNMAHTLASADLSDKGLDYQALGNGLGASWSEDGRYLALADDLYISLFARQDSQRVDLIGPVSSKGSSARALAISSTLNRIFAVVMEAGVALASEQHLAVYELVHLRSPAPAAPSGALAPRQDATSTVAGPTTTRGPAPQAPATVTAVG